MSRVVTSGYYWNNGKWIKLVPGPIESLYLQLDIDHPMRKAAQVADTYKMGIQAWYADLARRKWIRRVENRKINEFLKTGVKPPAPIVVPRSYVETAFVYAPAVPLQAHTINPAKFQKSEQELLAYSMPITKIIEMNSVKDYQLNYDQAAYDAFQSRNEGMISNETNLVATEEGNPRDPSGEVAQEAS